MQVILQHCGGQELEHRSVTLQHRAVGAILLLCWKGGAKLQPQQQATLEQGSRQSKNPPTKVG